MITKLPDPKKTFYTIETKWGVRHYSQAKILTLCLHTEKVRESVLHVQCSN